MSERENDEHLREKAIALGLGATAINGFLEMDRETLIIQAALWHQIAIAHQNQRLDVEMRSGEVIVNLFDLCRQYGIEVPEVIYEAANTVGETAPKAMER